MRNASIGALIVAVTMALPGVAQAHVSITPRQSTAGATEKYTVRIPTEGKVTTTASSRVFAHVGLCVAHSAQN